MCNILSIAPISIDEACNHKQLYCFCLLSMTFYKIIFSTKYFTTVLQPGKRRKLQGKVELRMYYIFIENNMAKSKEVHRPSS